MEDKQLGEFLNSLTPEQKAQLKNFLSPTKDEKPKRKQRRQTKEVEEEFVEPPRSNRRNQRGRKDRQEKRQKYEGNIPSGKAIAMKTNIITGKRPNLFIKSEEFNEHKDDAEIDRKLWEKKKPAIRDREGTIEVKCVKCNEIDHVKKEYCFFDKEDNCYKYTCDSCLTR